MIRRQNKLLLDTVLLGVVGALSAQAFMLLLRWSQALFLGWMAHLPGGGAVIPFGGHSRWLIPIATTLGGLIAGLIVYTLAPEAEGHGTDAAVNAFHNLRGVIRARVPFVKMIASAITIGSGGSAGREGPTALISAGIASIYAKWRRRSEAETRLLLLVGMAAGLSAIFRSPIGTAIFAIEVLYSELEFESSALVFTLLGAIVAYAITGVFVGFQPLFQVPANLPRPTAPDFGWYAIFGLACGVVATALPMSLYGVRDLFRRIPCKPHFKPAIAGSAVGLIAVAFPQLLGGGYAWIQTAIDGGLPALLLLSLAFGKIVTFSLTIGSGGSGGVFAPSLFTGAMLGGFLSAVFHQPPAAFAIVGMAAVFGAAARVPIATLIMVTSMTGGFHMFVAAALAVILSSLVQTLLSSSLRYKSLYEAQVPSRPYSPSHYMDHVRIALELLGRPDFSTSLDGRGLELVSLLNSGIPISLVEDKELRIGVLRAESPCAGRSVPSGCLGSHPEVEFILILRAADALWPHSDVKLQAGDRLIAVASDAAWSELAEHLDSIPGRPADNHPRQSHETRTPEPHAVQP